MLRPRPAPTSAPLRSPLPALVLVLALAGGAAAEESLDAEPEDGPPPAVVETADRRPNGEWGPLRLLDVETPPGERRDAVLHASESFSGMAVATRVAVLRGARPGLTLCATAAVHGDELNGVEIVRRVLEETDPGEMAGTLIGVPIVNLHGFRRNSRYLPDRRDLNRYFPGNGRGSSASRIAAAIFDGVIRRCDALVDLHTGSFHRTNSPQLRADLLNPAAAHLAKGFGTPVVVHNEGRPGTLRRAASEAGVPAITYEAGEPMRFQTGEIDRGVEGLRRLLRFLGLAPAPDGVEPVEQHFYYESHWVRVDKGGILFNDVELGELVERGDRLGSVTDPVTNARTELHSPFAGRLLGMALPQVVIPGFAAFHLGVEGEDPALGRPAPDLLRGLSDPDDGTDELEPEELPE